MFTHSFPANKTSYFIGDDGVINKKDVLQLQKEEYETLVGFTMPNVRKLIDVETFSKIDQNGTGYIERWVFMSYMALRYLSRCSPASIIKLLTIHEVKCFREYFKQYEEEPGRITQNHARKAYIDWYRSKIKPSKEHYVDWKWYGGLKENHFLEMLKSSIMGINEEAEKTNYISWSEYLKHCSLHILAARVNTVDEKPIIPPMPNILYANTDENDGNNNEHFLPLCKDASERNNYLTKYS